MIALAVFLGLILFVLFCKYIEDLVRHVLGLQRKNHERISTLETNDVTQDIRIYDHSAAIKDQGHVIRELKVEIREIGSDIGWDDSDRKTERVEPPPLPDEPDDAA